MLRWRLPIFICIAITTLAAGSYFQCVEDKYLWLEDNTNSRTIEWLADQHKKSEAYFDSPASTRITERLSAIMDMDIAFSPCTHQELTFFMARFKGKQQSSLYTVDSHNTIQTLVDAEALSADGTLSIADYVIPKEGGSIVAFGIKKNGSDKETWYFKNFRTGEMLSEQLSGLKFCPPIWDLDGEGLYYFRFEDNGQQELYYHSVGTSEEEDILLYTYSSKGALTFGLALCNDHYLKFNVYQSASNKNSIVFIDLTQKMSAAITNIEDFLNVHLKFIEVFQFDDARYSYVGTKKDRFYFVTDKDAARGKIISIDLANPSTSPQEELAEGSGIIQQAYFVKERLVIHYLINGCSEIKIADDQGNLSGIALPGTGTATLAKPPLDADAEEFFFSYTDFVHPSTLYRCQISTGKITPFMTPQLSWNPDDYEMRQLSYPSTDGTSVPLFVVHKKGLQLNGLNRTLLYAYGGFNIVLSPAFSAVNLAWIENGGVHALASIRGGGELGEEWHKAGMRHNKQQSFDDFMSAASYLCDKGYTQSSKLAVQGASNGGLLVGACLTQNQDLFKAAIAEVGVFDMLRFHLFTVGWAWIPEYGSPDDPEDFATLSKYSPYHCVQESKRYPSTLIITSDHDDRVVPLHSYKFAAALQEAQAGPNPIVLRVQYNTGHGAGKPRQQIIKEATEKLVFLSKELD